MANEFDNGNIFAVTSNWRNTDVKCSCGKNTYNLNTSPYKNGRVSSCPQCGTRNRGTFGKTSINHVAYQLDHIGDKQFKLTVQIRRYSPIHKKFTQNTKYNIGFNYLDKKYDIKVNGKDPRTKDIGNYYKRVLAKVNLGEVRDILDANTESSFWRCIFGIFSSSTSFGEALYNLISLDFSGIEIIATSRLSPLLKKANTNNIYRDYQNNNSILRARGSNLREVLGMTKGQINSMVRMTEYVMNSQGVRVDIKDNPIKILNTYHRLLKVLPMQHTEDLIRMAVEEGHFDYICENVNQVVTFMSDYGYTHDPIRFIRYILRDLKLEQGILSPNDGMRYLRDYLRMTSDLGREPERYPTSLKKVHDIAAMNYRVVSDKMKEKNFKRRSDELEHWLHRGRRFSFMLPQSPRDLVTEGTSLHHCVASYVDDVIRQNCAIVFMRSNKELDKSHVTIEVRNGRIVQARGQSNRQCTQEEKDAISAWANAKELEYRR